MLRYVNITTDEQEISVELEIKQSFGGFLALKNNSLKILKKLASGIIEELSKII